jgi:hypothetical protein
LTADRARPAAYIRADGPGDLARLRAAANEGARQRGWPPPQIYADLEPPTGAPSALARLEAAVIAGRHDALLITEPGAVTGTATHLMSLLAECTRAGVVVGLLMPAADQADRPGTPPDPELAGSAAELACQTWGVLARARLEALAGLFPDWRIWLDHAGWHARRRDTAWMQTHTDGTPVYSVHDDSPVGLAAQLCWQQAATRHAPDGCPASSPSP